MRRRQFVMSSAALGAAAAATELEGAREEFPWASRETYLATATEHPLGRRTTRAMEEYLHALTHGPDAARDKFENAHLMVEVKKMLSGMKEFFSWKKMERKKRREEKTLRIKEKARLLFLKRRHC